MPPRKTAAKPAAAEPARKKAKVSQPKTAALSDARAPTITLASGHKMPIVALGTWKSPVGKTADAVEAAIRAGYRYLDCANDYNNEDEIGERLAKLFAEGVVKREDLFIQAKLWNTNHRPEHIMPDLQATLDDLRISYVDSFVIHWPQAVPSTGKCATIRTSGAYPADHKKKSMFPVGDKGYFSTDKKSHYIETWHALEDLVDQGLVRSIGVSNFNKTQLEEVIKSVRKHPVSVLQNECHPYLQQKDLVDFCKINNVAFQAYSPLGSGDTHLAATASPTGTIPLKDAFIAAMAKKYKKTPAQIMLKWNLQRGVCIVAKSITAERIVSNFELFGWELSAEDLASFASINYGWRHLLWREASDHPDYPFKSVLPHNYVLEKPAMESSSGTKA